MKYLKNSMLGIISFMCLVIIAGYINYEYNETREKNLGQTVYVVASEGEIINTNDSNEYTYNKNDSQKYYFLNEKIDLIKKALNKCNLSKFNISYNTENSNYIILVNSSEKDKINEEKLKSELGNINIEIYYVQD